MTRRPRRVIKRVKKSAGKRRQTKTAERSVGCGTRNPGHPDFHPSKAEQNRWRQP